MKQNFATWSLVQVKRGLNPTVGDVVALDDDFFGTVASVTWRQSVVECRKDGVAIKASTRYQGVDSGALVVRHR